jgi:hypothetical protein
MTKYLASLKAAAIAGRVGDVGCKSLADYS